MVSIDRVGFKPPDTPSHPEYDHKGMIHWDTDMTKYPDLPFHVQGVLVRVTAGANQVIERTRLQARSSIGSAPSRTKTGITASGAAAETVTPPS